MEQTFITIHNLTPDADILFVSESVTDILGYQPSEVQGKSCFDYFHPDEVPFARSIHSRGVLLDKAAVLHYARIMSKDGQWVSCECCFTIVHDVLMACTSIYRRSHKQERRAIEAPHIRRLFSSSPRDPRYHMLEHLSPKFKMPPMEREPRAALILNRFTRSLTVMFATNAITSVLGVTPEQVQNKSFWECVAENCVADAINCLESAKANDSIAYLRFWSRDPRREEDFEDEDSEDTEDEEDAARRSISSNDLGGMQLSDAMEIDSDEVGLPGPSTSGHRTAAVPPLDPLGPTSSNSKARAGLPRCQATTSTADEVPRPSRSSSRPESRLGRQRRPLPSIELEAVVSCTSDGLVVVLRKARPQIPNLHPPLLPLNDYENGLFAAPWSDEATNSLYPAERFHTFQPPLLTQHMPLQEHVKEAGGPPIEHLMRAIRDVAVFAWALVGINGNIARYGRGTPRGNAQPHDGLPAWESHSGKMHYLGAEPQATRRWSNTVESSPHGSHSGSCAATHVPGLTAEAPQCYSRTSSGFNSNGSSAYTNPPAWSQSAAYATTSQSLPPYHAAPTLQTLPPPYPTLPRSQEPWVEASASYSQQGIHNTYPIPTPQSTSETGDSPRYRIPWQ
ncbi:hypothetical protein SLS62_008506 [Diatrype stigma]|uniref:PAS domain-containing protein n=1 Tax=Diatrype stigma TaxID=117547 RepID=A0AAN9UKB2_9PEZI